jgi:hypothetical protein
LSLDRVSAEVIDLKCLSNHHHNRQPGKRCAPYSNYVAERFIPIGEKHNQKER